MLPRSSARLTEAAKLKAALLRRSHRRSFDTTPSRASINLLQGTSASAKPAMSPPTFSSWSTPKLHRIGFAGDRRAPVRYAGQIELRNRPPFRLGA
jgi:hypothetical protein